MAGNLLEKDDIKTKVLGTSKGQLPIKSIWTQRSWYDLLPREVPGIRRVFTPSKSLSYVSRWLNTFLIDIEPSKG